MISADRTFMLSGTVIQPTDHCNANVKMIHSLQLTRNQLSTAECGQRIVQRRSMDAKVQGTAKGSGIHSH